MQHNYLKEVRNQYEEFPYPPLKPEDEKLRLRMPFTDTLPYITHYCYGGLRDLRNGGRVLIAGGGTGDATIALAEQLRGSDAEIVYVDLSTASQAIARERARIRGIEDNIKWIHGSLLDIPQMDLGTFDFINCSGVLHHLADPVAGLDALVSVLKPDGAMGIMLYAKYGRLAVYQLQEALRLINHRTQDPQQRVEHTKTLLNAMPASNWFLSSPQTLLNEVHMGDAGIYDLLLHSQDRAYSVPELYQFMRGAGLDIVQFYANDPSLGKKQYNPLSYVKDERLVREMLKLPLERQQELAELLNGKIFKHTVHVVRQKIPAPSLEDPDMVPYMSDIFPASVYEQLLKLVESSPGEVVELKPVHENITVYIPKTPHLMLFLQYLDGKRTMGELLPLVQAATGAQKPSTAELIKEFSVFYMRLHEYHWMLLRHKTIPMFTDRPAIQKRLMRMYA